MILIFISLISCGKSPKSVTNRTQRDALTNNENEAVCEVVFVVFVLLLFIKL